METGRQGRTNTCLVSLQVSAPTVSLAQKASQHHPEVPQLWKVSPKAGPSGYCQIGPHMPLSPSILRVQGSTTPGLFLLSALYNSLFFSIPSSPILISLGSKRCNTSKSVQPTWALLDVLDGEDAQRHLLISGTVDTWSSRVVRFH